MIEKGQIYWLKEPIESEYGNMIAHPQVVIQETAINQSRIETIVVCGISTNMARAFDVGNVLLQKGEGGLEQQSFISVGQVSTVPKPLFGRLIGKLDDNRIEQTLAGIMLRAHMIHERE